MDVSDSVSAHTVPFVRMVGVSWSRKSSSCHHTGVCDTLHSAYDVKHFSMEWIPNSVLVKE